MRKWRVGPEVSGELVKGIFANEQIVVVGTWEIRCMSRGGVLIVVEFGRF